MSAWRRVPGRSLRKRLQLWLRDSLVAGLVAAAPLFVVWVVVDKLILSVDGVLGVLPDHWREVSWTPPWADAAIPFLKTPGLGFVLSLVLLVAVGAVARGIVGRRIVARVTRAVTGVPLLGTVYSATRKLMETVFSSKAQSFRRVVLVEFPRRECWAVGFVIARAWAEAEQVTGRQLVSVFVPTTPNPTSGFYIVVPEEQLLPMSMTVEDAFKAIMSGGIVTPEAAGGAPEVDVQSMTAKVEAVKGG